MKVIYIAGPYAAQFHPSYHQVERNIAAAREMAAWLAEHGYGFFCPHLNRAHFEVITPNVPTRFWRQLDLRFLIVCDGLITLDNWQYSDGAQAEVYEAECADLPVFHSPEELLEGLPPLTEGERRDQEA
jgi:hypothetical protein